MADIASILGVSAEQVDLASWVRTALAGGMPAETARRLTAMFREYDRLGLVGNPATLTTLLGRTPNNALAGLLRDLPS